MKSINLISLINAKRELSEYIFKTYLQEFNIDIKENELLDIDKLVNQLNEHDAKLSTLNQYYIGYKINQISKEFDLLRIGDNYIVNIELKSKKTKEAIREQLIENKYYLKSVNKNIYSFTYVSKDNKLYKLDNDNELIESKFETLISILNSQELLQIDNIHNLFEPSNYLISPFNTTKKFIEGNYFLTDHQRQIKREIMDDKKIIKFKFVSIEGAAGTGKTLFAYDIAKEYILSTKKVVIIHCGILNEGHKKLINDYGWLIIGAKDIDKHNLSQYDLILVDEAQRIFKAQIKYIIETVKETETKCIFSYDKSQYLRVREKNNKISNYIDNKVEPKKFKLKEKVRTNKEIAGFIKNLFDLSKRDTSINYSNIDIKYFSNSEDALDYMKIMKGAGWEIINYTPSNYDHYPYDKFEYPTDKNAHTVIGQEFDKVVAVIDEHFYYEEYQDSKSGKRTKMLTTKNYTNRPYYHPTKMLFQILTRAKKKLTIIVINNEELLSRCIKIINHN